MTRKFSKVVIVGLGLIGGSLGKAFIKNNICNEVWGTDISTPVLLQGLNDKAITHYSQDKAETFKNAEVVILAAPVDKILLSFQEILPYLAPDTLVTDTGSVKEKIVSRAVALAGEHIQFLGGHPMAGSEKEGIGAAKAELLDGHTYIFTPHKDIGTIKKAQEYIAAIKAIGMEPAFLEPDVHDSIVANISHLPHVIAAILMTAVGTKSTPKELKTFTGNGFKDTTRISAGSPELWTQILSLNRANVLEGLEQFETALKMLKDHLQHNDIAALRAFLEYASAQRTRLTAQGGIYG